MQKQSEKYREFNRRIYMNIIERNIPDEIKGIGKIDKYEGVWAITPTGRKAAHPVICSKSG
jgi:hypothetical protein